MSSVSLFLAYTYTTQLIMYSHKGYSFITVRYLRRVEIRDAFLLSEVVLLLMTCLRDLPCLPDATDSIEWPECDELLMTRTSASVQRNARSIFSTLSQ